MFSGYTQGSVQRKLHLVLGDLGYNEAGILYAWKSMTKDLCGELILRADTGSWWATSEISFSVTNTMHTIQSRDSTMYYVLWMSYVKTFM